MPMNVLKHGRGLVAVVALMLCTLSGSLARAETDAEKKQRAKEHYEIATRLYDVGKYGDAIKEYESAYLLTGDPALLFNIGQAYRLWDRPEDALRVYKNYLRQRPDAVNRADVEKKIADLEKVIEERHRTGVPVAEPPSAIAPPPAGVATEPPPAGAAGTPGFPPEGTSPEPAANLMAQPAPPPAPARTWLTYSLLGVSGAALLTAAVAGAIGASKAKKLQDASQNRQVFDPSLQSSGKAANAVAFVSGLIGIAAGGVGGYFLWRDHKAARATVTLAPALTPAYAGGTAWVSF
jgi:tetratricopeptide (TPR) repeat protein